jgi:hypothetical protein
VADQGDVTGDIFLAQDGDTLYMMILLTDDYDAVVDDWSETVLSFTPGQFEPPADSSQALEIDEPQEIEVPTQFEDIITSGFTPEVNGFSFYNYGDDIPVTDLTAAEIQRMFGDRVCASIVNEECILTPVAQQWMEQINGYMAGGHCEGMAVLSALIYYDQADPADFGAEITNNLTIENNEPLQREIAYWWTTQATWPGAAVQVSEKPGEILDTLLANFDQGKNAQEWWVIGIFKRDGSDGHAITPFGVEDTGDGIYHVLVYDNNYPNETRALIIDRNANTWQYEGSPNPEIESDLYEGDADSDTLSIVAITPRLGPQDCDFCSGDNIPEADEVTTGVKNSAASQPEDRVDSNPWLDTLARWDLLINGKASDYYQIWLDGEADLLVVDDWGRRIGYDQGEFVNEIPGASMANMKFFQTEADLDTDRSPVLRIPVGLSFEVIMDATNIEEPGYSDLAMIGPGYYFDVTEAYLEPGDVESIGVFIDKSRHQLTYNTSYADTPDISLGLEGEEADYALIIRATELIGEDNNFTVALDSASDEFIINTSGNTDASTYEMYVLRIDDEGERVFGATDVVLDPENTLYMPFTDLDLTDTALPFDVDYENDAEIDDTFELPDVTGEIDFYADDQTVE